MEQKDSKIFNKSIMQAVSAFCDANNIEDRDEFIYLCFKQGFDIKKFGLLGNSLNEGEKDLKTGIVGEKQVEIEVIREIRVEVPVEVIKEVPIEVIKEIPVEKVFVKEIIKEVPVEKIVEVTKEVFNNEEIEKLKEENQKLKSDLEKITSSLDNLGKGRFMKNSNLNSLYDE